MSRCFPFPPPGYVVNGIRDEALIDSIKGAEEKVKKELKRKERKREKKEKKDKKRKDRERGEGESEKHSHKRRRKDEGVRDAQNNHKVDAFRKENNCLEKSSLTVERELLQSTSQNSCDSTLNSNELPKQKVKPTLNGRHDNKDSSLNSNELLKEKEKHPLSGRLNNNDSSLNNNEILKQKEKQPLSGRHNNKDSSLNSSELLKQKQPLNGRHNNKDSALNSNELPKEKEKQALDGEHNNNNNDSESIIRIRLPIRRPKHPEVMMITNKDQPCPSRELKLDTSKSVTTEQLQHPCSTSAPQHASKPHEEKRKDNIFTGKKLGKEKTLSFTTEEASQPSSLCRFCPPSMAVQFLNVVENWVPSTIESRIELTNSEDEESWWLMKKPSSNKIDRERCKQLSRNNETKQVISSSIAWPRARLLPEADVYALPYTVPF